VGIDEAVFEGAKCGFGKSPVPAVFAIDLHIRPLSCAVSLPEFGFLLHCSAYKEHNFEQE
jgi:hypothetical protein